MKRRDTTRIQDLHELSRAAINRKSVCVPKVECFRGPLPAAFVINMAGSIILRLINHGMFIYKKDPKKAYPGPTPL